MMAHWSFYLLLVGCFSLRLTAGHEQCSSGSSDDTCSSGDDEGTCSAGGDDGTCSQAPHDEGHVPPLKDPVSTEEWLQKREEKLEKVMESMPADYKPTQDDLDMIADEVEKAIAAQADMKKMRQRIKKGLGDLEEQSQEAALRFDQFRGYLDKSLSGKERMIPDYENPGQLKASKDKKMHNAHASMLKMYDKLMAIPGVKESVEKVIFERDQDDEEEEVEVEEEDEYES